MFPPFDTFDLGQETAAIAFSGGGDSTAMVHAFRAHPSVTHVFIIDHNLRGASAAEVSNAAAFAKSLGYKVETKCWKHDGVTSGIQMKARAYRYTALGEMCRAADVKHLLTAHTADDQAETLLMRIDRQTGWRGLAGMPRKAYAPLWPALAGVSLHRPWLNLSRAELRTYNREHDLPFIDDPSNENREFTRVCARQTISADQTLRTDLLEQQVAARARLQEERAENAAWLSKHAKISVHGFIETDAVPPEALMLHLLTVAAGAGGPIDVARRRRLCEDMARADFKAATLGGAWIVKTAHSFVFARDMVAVTGRADYQGLGTVGLRKGNPVLWDGRFWVTSEQEDMTVDTAFGDLKKLQQSTDLKGVLDIPKMVRPTLPLVRQGDEIVGFGAFDTDNVRSQAVAARRLHAIYPNTAHVLV